jgi:leucyl-tRNA synthetase
LKFGFYDFQSIRDWYREVTADVGMHHDLVQYWIRSAALVVTTIAPHFSEHIWTAILKNPQSIQLAIWPTLSDPVDRTLIEAGQYMRGTIKIIRDAEVSLLKVLTKAKGKKSSSSVSFYDPKKPKAVRIYVATAFPQWQDTCVQIIKEAYSKEEDKVDDAKVKQLLTERELIKDKRLMPFIQAFKVCHILFQQRIVCFFL